MATIRSYSATFEQTALANAALTRWRFNEDAGVAIALDSVDALDGSYETGAAAGFAGSIGDGAARFDGATGRVLVSETLTGTFRVAAFGDSEVVNTGIMDPSQRYVPELDAALDARGLSATVLNRGISGNTSTQALARVDNVIADDPDVVIIELGTNDALQTFDQTSPAEDTAANLTSMIEAFQAEEGIEVLLTGAFGFYPDLSGGTGYATEGARDAFEAIFPTVANTTGVDLLNADGSDKFLGGTRQGEEITGGVLGDPALNLDGLHPNAAGVDDIVARTRDPVIRAAPAGLISDAMELANGSVELWFTPDSVSGTQMLFSKNAPGVQQGDIEIQLVGDEVAVSMQNGSNTFEIHGGSVTVDQATHVVFKFGAGGMELYVDGVLEASNPFTGGLTGNLDELGVGARADGSLAFDGVIDEVAVYDRALSVGEIQQLFDGGELGTTVLGTANADTILGGSDDEDLRGAFGADTILARGGEDALRGGSGPDDLRGGSGDDRLFGGRGADDLTGAAGDDRLFGQGGKDELSGGAGEDLLDADGGRDVLAGGDDADRLFGGPAVDQLSGGAGDDLLNGGPGRDSLLGGSGGDKFQIDKVNDGIDRIRDFSPGEGDILDLSAVLDFEGGDDADAFVQLNESNGHTDVDVDPNGAGGDFTTVFRLLDTTGLDLDTLVADGNVRLEPPPTS